MRLASQSGFTERPRPSSVPGSSPRISRINCHAPSPSSALLLSIRIPYQGLEMISSCDTRDPILVRHPRLSDHDLTILRPLFARDFPTGRRIALEILKL